MSGYANLFSPSSSSSGSESLAPDSSVSSSISDSPVNVTRKTTAYYSVLATVQPNLLFKENKIALILTLLK